MTHDTQPRAVDLLTAHFERLRGQTYTVPGITGPDGAPLVVYFDPPTSADAQRVRARAGDNEAKLTLYTVICLAKTASGERMFADDAKTIRALSENVPAAVLAKIAVALMATSDPDELGN